VIYASSISRKIVKRINNFQSNFPTLKLIDSLIKPAPNELLVDNARFFRVILTEISKDSRWCHQPLGIKSISPALTTKSHTVAFSNKGC